jgi:anti-anti-sigma regulatory factor
MSTFHFADCLRNLFAVQTTPPGSRHWHTALWGGVGLFVSLIYVIFPLPALLARLPEGSVAISAMLLRVVQVALLGAWIVWRQPWRATSPQQQRLGRLVMVMVAVLLFPAVATLLLHSDWIDVLPYYLVTTVCLLQIFWLSRRGLVRLAALLLTLTLIVQQIGISALSSSNDVGPASAPLIYGLIILIGGFSVGWWFGLLVALALPSTITILAGLELIAMTPDWSTTALYVILLSAYAGLTALYTRSLDTALQEAARRTDDLAAARQALEETNSQLEQRIAERTAALEQSLAAQAAQAQALATSLAEQQRLNQTINDLSFPIIPVRNDTLILPLIGVLSTPRASALIETALKRIEQTRARRLFIDVTGVAVIDTLVAQALLRLAAAVRLLGATVTLVGIRPEVAQTLVSLGADFKEVRTAATLQEGLAGIDKSGAS